MRILILGLLGLRGGHVWPISPTILKIVGFPQAIVFYELVGTVFGATVHNRHARQDPRRTSFRANFSDSEESAKQ